MPLSTEHPCWLGSVALTAKGTVDPSGFVRVMPYSFTSDSGAFAHCSVTTGCRELAPETDGFDPHDGVLGALFNDTDLVAVYPWPFPPSTVLSYAVNRTVYVELMVGFPPSECVSQFNEYVVLPWEVASRFPSTIGDPPGVMTASSSEYHPAPPELEATPLTRTVPDAMHEDDVPHESMPTETLAA